MKSEKINDSEKYLSQLNQFDKDSKEEKKTAVFVNTRPVSE